MGEKTKQKFSFGRFILIAGIAAVVLLGAAILIVPRMIPWDKVKKQAETKISETVHHKVSIGTIGFNLFRGIEVTDVVVANGKGFSKEPLLSDQAVVVQYRLLPLLFGKIAIKAIVLKQPQLVIEKKADGTFNFSDMIPAKQAKQVEKKEPAAGLPPIPLELLVSEFAIENAKLVYRDSGKKQEYRLDGFDLSVKNLTLAGLTPVQVALHADVKALGQTIPVDLKSRWRFNYAKENFVLDQATVTVPGVVVQAAGTLDKVVSGPLANMTGSTRLDFQKIRTSLLPAEIRKKIPADIKTGGTATIDFSVRGPVKEVPKLAIEVKNSVQLQLGAKGIDAPVSVQGKLALNSTNATVEQKAVMPGVDVTIAATVKDVLASRKLSGDIKSTINVEECFAKLVPPAVLKKLTELQTSGKVTADLHVSGAIAKPKEIGFDTQIKVHDVRASYREKVLLEGMNLEIAVKPNLIDFKNLKADLAGQPLQGKLKVTGLDLRDPETLKPAAMKAHMQWELSSKLLDLDAMLALIPKKAEAKNAQGKKTEKPAPAKPVSDLPEPDVRKFIPAGLSVRGKASLGGVKFGKVKIGKVEFRMEQKQRVIQASGTVRGYQGQIENTTRLDYSKAMLAYGVNADVKNVDLEPLMNDIVDTFVAAKLKKPKIISELKDKMTGRLTGKLKLQGKGLRTSNAMPNLSGEGNYVLRAGRLRQFGFQENLAKMFGSEKFRQDIPFDNTVMDFTIARQKVNVKKFIMESGVEGTSGDIRMTAEGVIRFKAEFENFKLRPRLNPRASQTLSQDFRQYSEILKDDRGWVTIPVILNGPLKKPRVDPDWNWIKAQMGRYAKKKADAVKKSTETKAKKFIEKQKGKSTKEIQKDVNKELEKAKESIKKMDFKNLFK